MLVCWQACMAGTCYRTSHVTYTLCDGSLQPLPVNTVPGRHANRWASYAKYPWLTFASMALNWLFTSLAARHHCMKHVLYVTGQNTLHYVLQCLLFTTWLSCRSGDRGIIFVLKYRGWRYLLLTLVDMEANYMYITAHQFTTLTSIQVTILTVPLLFNQLFSG